MDFKKDIHDAATMENDSPPTITEIKRGADLFKLLFEWQKQSLKRDGNFEEFDEAS